MVTDPNALPAHIIERAAGGVNVSRAANRTRLPSRLEARHKQF